MKSTLVLLVAGVLLFHSLNANADRAWIGGKSVVEVFYANNNGSCGPNGGACMRIQFGPGYLGCEFVAISKTDIQFEAIQSLALVSITAGKSLSLFGDNDYCNDSDRINVNAISLK